MIPPGTAGSNDGGAKIGGRFRSIQATGGGPQSYKQQAMLQ
tara:strand:+ start:2478 stop:2600 length:123 start_codon:yes stop_codon:yes gene_type:complete